MSTPDPSQAAPEVEPAKFTPTIPASEEAAGFMVSNEELFSRQDKIYSKKESDAPVEEKPLAPVPDRAAQLLEQHKKIETPAPAAKEPAKEEPPVVEQPPVPTIEFMGEKKEAPKKEEPAPVVDIEKENNIKNIRVVAGTFKSERDAALARVQELEAQVASTPNVDALHVEIENLRTRNAELEPLEMVYNLHNHPEFKTKFLDGEKQIRSEMEKIASDYGVDPKVIEEVIAINNRKDLDEVLTETFPHESARQDIKGLKSRIDNLYRERREFEKKPQDTLQKWQSEREQQETYTVKQRDEHFSRVENEGWTKALSVAKTLPQDKKIFELIEIPGNNEHNEKIVRPALGAAKEMVTRGLRHIEAMIRNQAVIDGGFSQWFSALVQQAVVAQMLNESRSKIWSNYQELKQNSESARSDDHPGLNGSPRSNGVAPTGAKEGSPAAIWAWMESQQHK